MAQTLWVVKKDRHLAQTFTIIPSGLSGRKMGDVVIRGDKIGISANLNLNRFSHSKPYGLLNALGDKGPLPFQKHCNQVNITPSETPFPKNKSEIWIISDGSSGPINNGDNIDLKNYETNTRFCYVCVGDRKTCYGDQYFHNSTGLPFTTDPKKCCKCCGKTKDTYKIIIV